MQQTENLAPHIQEITRALQNRMEPEAIEDELRRYLEYGVPLAQAKRDIVRMHGGTLTAGPKKINTIMPEDKGVELVAKILTVNPKEITVKGQTKQIWFGFIADDTGKTSYTAWKDHNLQRGSWVKVRNAYAKKGFREGVDLSLGDYSIVEVAADPGWTIADDFTPNPESAARLGAERKVRELRDGMSGVNLTGRLLDVREKAISTANGQKTLVEGEIADGTGRVAFSAWEPEKLPKEFKANAVVLIKSGYVRAYRGVPNLNIGQYSTIEMLASDAAPDAATLMEPQAFTLGELESAGGGQGIRVEGVILEVKKGSGLIFRCATEACNRVLQNKECRVHGKQKGVSDLRIKAVLDDGRGVATFFANREATERVLGKTLAQCESEARDAMTTDVVQDELVQKLTTRRALVTGNATSDEFGLQIIASDLVFAPTKDYETEAERLLGALAEFSQEVGA